MPPKIKLHNKHGKVKSFPSAPNTSPSVQPAPVQEVEAASEPSTSTESQSDVDRQFEVELCWCIQQLEISLTDKKLNPKQTQESMKILKVLRNKSQPTVRKRQLMRTHFGDYRAIMAREDKKAKKSNDQITFAKPSASNSKSTFLRKSLFLTTGDNSFRFNFQSPKNAITVNNIQLESLKLDQENNVKGEDLKNNANSIANVPSENSSNFYFSNEPFKFNFNIDENV